VNRSDFPGVNGWHYLDTAATAQKPQIVIDAMSRAMGVDYATVHRGVYKRSADMTLAFEAARNRVASFIGANSENEIIFTKGATEGINLVAQCWPSVPGHGRRVLLSQLEHHSNIVPWQLAGWQVDVCPLTADGQIDLQCARLSARCEARGGIGSQNWRMLSAGWLSGGPAPARQRRGD
jgi:cysteine desulfurase / selenocysteine lyase